MVNCQREKLSPDILEDIYLERIQSQWELSEEVAHDRRQDYGHPDRSYQWLVNAVQPALARIRERRNKNAGTTDPRRGTRSEEPRPRSKDKQPEDPPAPRGRCE